MNNGKRKHLKLFLLLFFIIIGLFSFIFVFFNEDSFSYPNDIDEITRFTFENETYAEASFILENIYGNDLSIMDEGSYTITTEDDIQISLSDPITQEEILLNDNSFDISRNGVLIKLSNIIKGNKYYLNIKPNTNKKGYRPTFSSADIEVDYTDILQATIKDIYDADNNHVDLSDNNRIILLYEGDRTKFRLSGNQDVTIEYYYSVNELTDEQLDSTSFNVYDKKNFLEFQTNGYLYTRSKYLNDSYSPISTLHINNIDKIDPIGEVLSITESNTKDSATVRYKIHDGEATNEYGKSGVVSYAVSTSSIVSDDEWLDGADDEIGTFETMENQTFYLHVKDKAGNTSVNEIVVDNITYTAENNILIVLSSTNNALKGKEYKSLMDFENDLRNNNIASSDELVVKILDNINNQVLNVDNVNLTMDLNGYRLTSSRNKPILTIGSNGTLKLLDNKYTINDYLEGDYSNYSSGNIPGSIINSVDTAILNNGSFTIGEDNSPDIIHIEYPNHASPYVYGKTEAVINNNVFNYYDGVIEGALAIRGTITDTPPLYDPSIIENDDNNYEMTLEEVSSVEALIGKVRYTLLEDAIEAANNTQGTINNPVEIDIIRNISKEETINIPDNKNIILDLNGNTFTNSRQLNVLHNYGTVTLKSSLADGNITISTSNAIINDGTMTIDSGLYETTANQYATIINNSGKKLTINGGTFKNKSGNYTYPSIYNKGGELIVNGGEILANPSASGSNRADTAIYNNDMSSSDEIEKQIASSLSGFKTGTTEYTFSLDDNLNLVPNSINLGTNTTRYSNTCYKVDLSEYNNKQRVKAIIDLYINIRSVDSAFTYVSTYDQSSSSYTEKNTIDSVAYYNYLGKGSVGDASHEYNLVGGRVYYVCVGYRQEKNTESFPEGGSVFKVKNIRLYEKKFYPGKLTINGGTFDKYNSVYNNSYYDNVVINNGTFNGYIKNDTKAYMTINNGTFNYYISNNSYSNMVINGGTFKEDINNTSTSTMTINGGSFKYYVYNKSYSTMNISNGIFNGTVTNQDYNTTTMNITGGTFNGLFTASNGIVNAKDCTFNNKATFNAVTSIDHVTFNRMPWTDADKNHLLYDMITTSSGNNVEIKNSTINYNLNSSLNSSDQFKIKGINITGNKTVTIDNTNMNLILDRTNSNDIYDYVYGIYNEGATTLNIKNSSIISSTSSDKKYTYGIYTSNYAATVNIGTNDSIYNEASNTISGDWRGIYNHNSKINLYDGIIKSKNDALNTTISNIETNYNVLRYTNDGYDIIKLSNKEYNIQDLNTGSKYYDLLDALSKYQAPMKLVILNDYYDTNNSLTIDNNQDISIDLNGKRNYIGANIVNNGKLAISDGVGTSKTNLKSIVNNGDLSFTGGDILYELNTSTKCIENNGTLNITSTTMAGEYLRANQYLIYNNNVMNVNTNTKININDNTNSFAIYNTSTGSVYFNDGEINTNVESTSIMNIGGYVEINGGTIQTKGDSCYASWINSGESSADACGITVHSKNSNDYASKIVINGGTIDNIGGSYGINVQSNSELIVNKATFNSTGSGTAILIDESTSKFSVQNTNINNYSTGIANESSSNALIKKVNITNNGSSSQMYGINNTTSAEVELEDVNIEFDTTNTSTYCGSWCHADPYYYGTCYGIYNQKSKSVTLNNVNMNINCTVDAAVYNTGSLNQNSIININNSTLNINNKLNRNSMYWNEVSYGVYDTGSSNYRMTYNVNNSSITVTKDNTSYDALKAYGIYSNVSKTPSVFNISNNDNAVSIEKPSISGYTYGIYRTSGTLNFYDGIFKGNTTIFGGVNDKPDSYELYNDVEGNLNTTYLKQLAVVKNTDTDVSYSSLQEGINKCTDNQLCELELLNDINLGSIIEIPSRKNIYLNLGEYNILTTEEKYIVNKGTITFTNGVLLSEAINNFDPVIENQGSLIIGDALTVKNELSNNIKLIINRYQGNLIIDGGTIITTGSATPSSLVSGRTIYNEGGYVEVNNLDLTITPASNVRSIYNTSITVDDELKQGRIVINNMNVTLNQASTSGKANIYCDSNAYLEINNIDVNDSNYYYSSTLIAMEENSSFLINDGTITKYYSGIINMSGSATGTIDNINITNVSSYGITTNGNSQLTINDINAYNGKNDFIRSLDDSKITINKGLISKNTENGAYIIHSSNNSSVDIDNLTINSNATYGLYLSNNSSMTVKNSSITAYQYGAYIDGTSSLTIGNNTDSVSNSTPYIYSKSTYGSNTSSDGYGVYNKSGKLYYYDGIIKGHTDIYGHISGTPDGYQTVHYVDGSYNYSILEEGNPFKNGVTGVEYPNLPSALGSCVENVECSIVQLTDSYMTEPITINSNMIVNIDFNNKKYYTTKDTTFTNNGTLSMGNGYIVPFSMSDQFIITNNGTLHLLDGLNITSDYKDVCFLYNSYTGKMYLDDVLLKYLPTAGDNDKRDNRILKNEGGYVEFNAGHYYGRSGWITWGRWSYYIKMIYSTSKTVDDVVHRGQIVINGGIFEDNSASYYSYGFFTANNTDFTITGGKFISGVPFELNNCSVVISGATSEKNYGFIDAKDTNVNIISGTFAGTSGNYGIKMSSSNIIPTLNITNATFDGFANGLYMNANTKALIDNVSITNSTYGIYTTITNAQITDRIDLTIKNGNITASNTGIYVPNNNNSSKTYITLGVNDGNVSTTSPSITGTNYGIYRDSQINTVFKFYDGIIRSDGDPIHCPVDEVPDDYRVTSYDEHSYILKIKSSIQNTFEYGGMYYQSITMPINVINSTENKTGTISLGNDVTLTSPITIPEGTNITLVLQGHSIIFDGVETGIINNGTFTVIDGDSEELDSTTTSHIRNLGGTVIENNGTMYLGSTNNLNPNSPIIEGNVGYAGNKPTIYSGSIKSNSTNTIINSTSNRIAHAIKSLFKNDNNSNINTVVSEYRNNYVSDQTTLSTVPIIRTELPLTIDENGVTSINWINSNVRLAIGANNYGIINLVNEPNPNDIKEVYYNVEVYLNNELDESKSFKKLSDIQYLDEELLYVDRDYFEHAEKQFDGYYLTKMIIDDTETTVVPEKITSGSLIKLYYKEKEKEKTEETGIVKGAEETPIHIIVDPPKTGDYIYTYIFMLLISVTVIPILVVLYNKKRKEIYEYESR